MQDIEVRVVGYDLKIKSDGDGPPLLFLHGAGGSSWNPLLKKLAGTHRVLAPEHPGFGGRPTPDWLKTVGDLAYFYLDVLAKLGLEGVHLVGHSLGGWTAAELAVRNTSRLASVVLMAPAGGAHPTVPYGDIFGWSPEEAARNQVFDQKIAEERIRALPSQDKKVAAENKATVKRLAYEPRLHNPELPFWLHRIDVPTLLVWGRDDKIVPQVCHERFLSEIKGARLITIPECGHAIHTEKANEAHTAMSTFYRSLET